MNKKFTAVILALSVSLQSAGLLYARESAGNGDLTEMTGQAVVQEYDMEAYENNEVLVLYKDGSCTTKTYSSKEELKNALYEMSKDELIDIVQPNYLYSSTAYRTDDELYLKQWGLENDGSFQMEESGSDFFEETAAAPDNGGFYSALAGIDINIGPAWEKYNGGRRAVVAVIDTGVDINHEDLKGALWVNDGEIAGNGIDDDNNGYVDDVYGYNFFNKNANVFTGDTDLHGTHVAGTIAAVRNNKKGIAGIASNANVKIMPLKVIGGEMGGGSTSSIIEAINYAENNGAVICNLSISALNDDAALYKTIAKSKMLFVVASGNNDRGTDNDQIPQYPSSYDLENIISVASIRSDGVLDPISNYGKKSVDIAAPGNRILSTAPSNQYKYMTGTSMAAPMVSAVCAMVYSYYDDITLKDVKEIVLNSASKLDSLESKVLTGGILNAGNAMNYDVSTLEHGQFNVPADAYIEDLPPAIKLETYSLGKEKYLKVTVTDINDDLLYLRYMNGNYSIDRFDGGKNGKPFALGKDNTCVFRIYSKGEYTFFASDKAGHETVARVKV